MADDSGEQIAPTLKRVQRAQTVQTVQLNLTIIGVLLVVWSTSQFLTLLAMSGTLFGAIVCWGISDELLVDVELALKETQAADTFAAIRDDLRED